MPQIQKHSLPIFLFPFFFLRSLSMPQLSKFISRLLLLMDAPRSRLARLGTHVQLVKHVMPKLENGKECKCKVKIVVCWDILL